MSISEIVENYFWALSLQLVNAWQLTVALAVAVFQNEMKSLITCFI
jgi:hypothetical protein